MCRILTPCYAWEAETGAGCLQGGPVELPALLLQGQRPGPRKPRSAWVPTDPASVPAGRAQSQASTCCKRHIGRSAEPVSRDGDYRWKPPSSGGTIAGGKLWASLAQGLVATHPALMPRPEAERETSC